MMIKKSFNIIIIFFIQYLAVQDLTAQQPSVYQVTKMPFNTETFSEISPVLVKDCILFCSDRRFSNIKDRTAWDGHRLYNLYIAERKDTSDWSKPKELKSERSSLFNNGPLCFAPDGKTVFFTSEVETGKVTNKKNFKNHSGIFIADLSGINLDSIRPFRYNNPQYEVGHPSVSNDGKFLFFASDMPGGSGASDLYYCELINGEWSTPVNMGPVVNSPGVENYPYMHPSGRLYFTSNRPGGIGNLDVYYTTLSLGKWDAPVLLPEPINSKSDDFAFVAEGNLQSGYFASSRGTSDDIYQFSSTIIRKASCDTLKENVYCYEFLEENAIKFDTMPFRYEWKFGDGGKGVGPVVQHCFAGAGSYIVQLDVVNLVTKEVLYNEKTYNLEIKDFEQPYISAPERTISGQLIKMNADSTNLPGWNIAQYYWNFGDETIAVGKEVDKTYLKPGTYNIQLIVSTRPEPGDIVREACVSKNIIVIQQP
jgi:hypothetical protein